MKKIMLACLFMFSCMILPVSANSETEVKNTKEVQYTEDGKLILNLDEMEPSKNIDLTNGLSVEHSPLPFAYGDIIYNDYYVTAPARKSINLGYFVYGYAGDRVLLEWDGATSLNPQMDIVIRYSDGTTFSMYDNYGFMVDKNAGDVIVQSSKPAQVNIWFSSYNYSDVVFYRITTKDGAN